MCPLVCRKVPLMGFLQRTAKTCVLRVPPSVLISRVLWDRVQVCVCCVNQAAIVIPVGDLLPPQDCVCVCVAIMQHGVSGTGV